MQKDTAGWRSYHCIGTGEHHRFLSDRKTGAAWIKNCDRCVEMTTNKARMRKRMQEAGLSGPDFCVVSREMAKNFRPVFPFPVVVKPTDRSGSRGVKRVDGQKQLRRAMEDAFSCSFEKKVIVEEWIEGKEYSCECLSWQGKHYCLAITEKYTTGAPEYVETGHLEPALLPDADKVRQEVFRVLDILEVKNGRIPYGI